MVEHAAVNRVVEGSSPSSGATSVLVEPRGFLHRKRAKRAKVFSQLFSSVVMKLQAKLRPNLAVGPAKNPGSGMSPALDLQLRERVREGGAGQRGFLVVELRRDPGPGPACRCGRSI